MTPLTERLSDYLDAHRVPGAAVAIFANGDLSEAAAGVCNIETGVAVTTDTLFQIGSITKLYTATLVLQLVEEGLVDLDAPVRDYIKDFDAVHRDRMTVRHLLTHTSGIQAELLEDAGDGDDCIERYVAALSTAEALHEPGERYSYSNASYTVAARVVECVTGESWDRALRARIFESADLQMSVTLAEEAILHRVAIGHIPDTTDGLLRRAPRWYFPRSSAPAGAICTTAADCVRFARIILDGGTAPNGTRLLGQDAMRNAVSPQATHPHDGGAGAKAVGLGWRLSDWGGLSAYGHDGLTIGQFACLRVVQAKEIIVAAFANGPGGAALFGSVVRPILIEEFGVPVPAEPEPVASANTKLERFEGTYARTNLTLHFESVEGNLVVSSEQSGPADLREPELVRAVVVAMKGGGFLLEHPGAPRVTFLFEDNGRDPLDWVYVRGRALRRTA